jgi:hypothetical protein
MESKRREYDKRESPEAFEAFYVLVRTAAIPYSSPVIPAQAGIPEF